MFVFRLSEMRRKSYCKTQGGLHMNQFVDSALQLVSLVHGNALPFVMRPQSLPPRD